MEYSYKSSSVVRTVSEGSNCIRYASDDNNGDNIVATQYIHCHGSKLLSDSKIGPSQYSGMTPLYIWTSSTHQEILFQIPNFHRFDYDHVTLLQW